MAAEYSASAVQTVAANGSVVFSESPVACNRGLIYHRDASGIFRLASPALMGVSCCRRCCCSGYPEALYRVSFGANIAVPGTPAGTVEAISLAVAIDGEIDPSSVMIVTPAAVDEYQNVSADVLVSVPCICRCGSVSIRNVSTQAVNVQSANLVIDYVGIKR